MTVTREVKHVTEVTHRSAQLHRSVEEARFGRCTIHFYPPSFVWSRLQELHRASLRPHDRKHLSPAKARSFYDAVRVTSLAQLWVGSDSARAAWFDHLLDAIARSRSFDGLETAFLSGLNTAALAGQHSSVTRAVHLWRKLGPPAKLGGGHHRSPVLDTMTDTILFLDHKAVASMGANGKHAGLVDANIKDLVAAVQGAGIADAGVAEDGDECEKFFKAGGALVGSSLGAIGGTLATAPGGVTAIGGFVAGTLAGGAAGATIGGALGGALCPGVMESGAATGGADGAGGAGSSPSDSIMFGSGDESGDGSESQSSQDENQSSQDTSNQSGGDSTNQSGGDDTNQSGGGDDDDSSGGMPDPDDPGGFPSPDDPHGRSWISDTAAFGSVAGYMSRGSKGSWSFSSVPRLAAEGKLASAGFLGAIPAVAARASESQTQANGSPVDKGALGGKTAGRVATP